MFKELLNIEPFSLDKDKKYKIFTSRLMHLNKLHYKYCNEYRKIIDFMKADLKSKKLEDMPFLLTKLFKFNNLISSNKKKDISKISSSGTSGDNVSNIFIDKSTSILQSKVLSKILYSILDYKMPLLIIESKKSLFSNKSLNARKIAVLGFSLVGKNITFALDDNEKIDYEAINNFLKKNNHNKFLIFGFTFIIWDFFHKLKLNNLKFKFDNGIIFHGGGWKKMLNKKIDNKKFKKYLIKNFNINKIYNYYGMVEQPGSIFTECDIGDRLHCSNFSDIIIRDSQLNKLPHNKKGIIQVLSLLPESYPGHNLITEDLGEILGEDDCPCGRKGKYFIVHGRIPRAEVRGCSDVYFE